MTTQPEVPWFRALFEELTAEGRQLSTAENDYKLREPL